MNHLAVFLCAIIFCVFLLTLKKRRPPAALASSSSAAVCSAVQDCAAVCVPKIQQVFPDFSLSQYTLAAEEALVSILQAISQQDSRLLVHCHERLQKQVDYIIAGQQLDGRSTPFDAVILQQTALSGCRQEQNHFNITFQCALDCRHYTLLDEQIIKGSATEEQHCVYSVVLDTDNWLFTYFERHN